jgi:hypothetical protein
MSVKELEDASKYTAYINTAFQNANIASTLPVSQEISLKDLEPDMILAFNNLKTIAGDQLANAIVDSIKTDTNKLIYLNRYFTQFKNTLPNQKIISIGDFTNRFDKFYTGNIGQLSLPETTRINTIDISDLSQKNLQTLPTDQIDKIFRDIYKKVNKITEITNGMTVEFIPKILITKKEERLETPIKKVLTIIKNVENKIITFDKYTEPKRVNDAKISYILEQSKAVFKPQSINWTGPISRGSGIVFPRSKVLKKKLVHFR